MIETHKRKTRGYRSGEEPKSDRTIFCREYITYGPTRIHAGLHSPHRL